ncbi:hypothetical protein C0995_016238, partial [Termitomyces sp. Mi166
MLKAAKAEAAATNANKKFMLKVNVNTTMMPLSTSNNSNITPTASLGGTKIQKYVYPLINAEHLLLLDHEGCTKHRKFYVGNDHTHNNCSQDKPLLLATYKMLTLELAKATKHNYIAYGGKPKNMEKKTLIAIVVVDGASSDE